MRKICLVTIFVFAVLSVAFSHHSVAVTDNALSIITNPAGLGFGRTFEGYIISPFDTSEFKDEMSMLLRAGNIGFASQFYGKGSNYNSFTISLGTCLGKNFYFGTGYQWFTRIKKSSAWDIGVLYRPTNFLSIGMTGKNINFPDDLYPEYVFGLGVRPFGNRFTISFDANLFKTETINYADEFNWTLGTQIEPIKGIVLKGHYAENSFGAGIGLNLKHFGIEGYGNFSDENELTDGYTIAHFSADRYRTILKRSKSYWVTLTLKNKIIEEKRKKGIFSKPLPTLKEVVDAIEKLTDDPEIAGIYIVMGEPQTGFAKKQEIRKALKRFKNKGKKIFCYTESMGNTAYYLATIADSIFMNPSGYLALTGMYSEIPFIKGTLEKIGIEPELERIGKYKSAADIVSADSMSDAFREVRNSILDNLYDQFVSTIAASRNMTTLKLKELIDRGPFTSKQAEAAGLVDRLLYEDEVVKLLSDQKIHLRSLRTYLLKHDYVYNWQLEPGEKIAVIYATGSIVSGKSGKNIFAGELMGSETIVKAIRTARKDKNIKAIVFRIDSGGGSGLASDVIWREVKRTTEGKDKKPFVVSMSDVAGSGGYYIACAADVILADEATITGSIGVIGGKFNFRGLYEKIGLKFETIERGNHAAIFSATKPFTEEERELVKKDIKEFYQDFIEKVADGRGLSVSKVDSIGKGRIWTGSQAKEIGLIDELGGLYEAIQIAKKKAGISKDSKVGIEIYPKYSVKLFGFGGSPIPGMESYIPEELLDIIGDYERFSIYENENILYIMPYMVKIK